MVATNTTIRRAIATAIVASIVISVAGAQDESHDGHAAPMSDAAHDALDSSNLHGINVDFELLDRDGNVVTDEDFRGKHVLLGFGFTHCAHICPMMALNMGKALSMAETEAVGIFVSVDTERDSPSRTDDYASNFGERMLGLGGDYDQVSAAATNFKVSYAVTKTQNNYTVQHTANVYVIDPHGKLTDVLTFSTEPEVLLGAIQ